MTQLVECSVCGRSIGELGYLIRCPFCGGIPIIKYDNPRFRVDPRRPGIWRYYSLLPFFETVVSRGEGLTPIFRVNNVLVKNERFNPTGSYADRASAIIASYLKSRGIKSVKVSYEPGFTKSILHYLRGFSKATYCIRDLIEVDIEDLFEISKFGEISTCRESSTISTYIDYMSALTIEGLKTILFEIFESRIDIEHIVVPAKTGVLAFSLAKGLEELRNAGAEPGFDVIAVFSKGTTIPDYLRKVKHIQVVGVSSDELMDSFKLLISEGIYTAPLSVMGFHIARSLGKSLAVLTIGYRPRIPPRKSKLRERILKTIEKFGKASAYDIWRYNNEYSLRGVYKAVKSMVKDGIVCEEPYTKRGRKVMLYKLCS